MVDSRESPPIISINADRSRTRQRFSIAHELGHLLLHDPGQRFRDNFSSMGLDLREIQANQFAAKLLMPSWMVNAYARVGARLTALAGLFDVSPQAMRIRLEQLGYNVT
jgi:Zn-dependent peptidase ImmA (M78 family)